MKEIKGFEGHVVLMYKHHYVFDNLLIALRQLWAIRCGYEYKEDDKSADRYIANKLYTIIQEVLPDKLTYFQEIIHEEICNTFRYPDYTPLEILISLYCSELTQLSMREQVGETWKWKIRLPKPKKRVLNRIFRGNGRYEDYKLLN